MELGAAVTQATAAQIQNFTEQQSVTCAKGYWCSAANSIACTPNTYNNLTNQIDAGACKLCPAMSESPEASTSRAACVCMEGYYDSDPDPLEVECVLCPAGSACAGNGVTLAKLPLEPGYYRTGNASSDLRRCPDAATTRAASAAWATAARARARVAAGPYCKLCNVTDTSRYYDAAESACVLCEGNAAAPVLIGAARLPCSSRCWRFGACCASACP